ncbi:MAG: iron complex transport system permease protein [Solirubrobacterales bacterium]|nr:iron complex transport system permease protein [Solirubrobacterales bacterium]
MARRVIVFAALLAALALATVASLAFGAVKVPFGEVLEIIFGNGKGGPSEQIVEALRLPRTVEALVVGAALGIAGAILQGALGNPLASPDVIGVTGGAGFGAILIIILFPGSIALLPVGALAFGLLAATLVFLFAWSGRNRGSVGKVILAGIAMLSLFTAGTTGLLAAYPERAPSAIFFIAGGLTSSGWEEMQTIWPYFAVGFAFALLLIRPLDRLALGDDVAASLGSRPQLIRLAAGIAAALLAAASAAIAGLLGFLGLVVPHVVRMAGGSSSHAFVVPASALGGAALLAGADTLARTLRAPIEMPVGPFMVILGVPLFLWLLRKAV